MLGPQSNYSANEPPNPTTIPVKGPTSAKKKSPTLGHVVDNNRGLGLLESSLSKNPPKEYPTPPQARGLHPPGALVWTHWQVKKSPGQFYPNHPGAQGLLSGTNSRVPEEEELMTIER